MSTFLLFMHSSKNNTFTVMPPLSPHNKCDSVLSVPGSFKGKSNLSSNSIEEGNFFYDALNTFYLWL